MYFTSVLFISTILINLTYEMFCSFVMKFSIILLYWHFLFCFYTVIIYYIYIFFSCSVCMYFTYEFYIRTLYLSCTFILYFLTELSSILVKTFQDPLQKRRITYQTLEEAAAEWSFAQIFRGVRRGEETNLHRFTVNPTTWD